LCLRATVDVCRDAIARCDELRRLRGEYHQKADRLSLRAHTLIENLFSNPLIRIVDVKQRLDITYPTAKSDVEKLVDLGILAELDGTYPKAYFAPEIFGAAYGEER
jgi:Fic family protein